MALTVGIMHGCGPSIKMHPQLTAKKDKGKAVLAVNIAAKGVICAVITNRTEHFSFKCGCLVQVAKYLKRLVHSVAVAIAA